MLPNSTERAVTVSGTAEAVTACIKVVCNIMLEVCLYGLASLVCGLCICKECTVTFDTFHECSENENSDVCAKNRNDVL